MPLIETKVELPKESARYKNGKGQFIGFDTETADYFENMIECLENALTRYKEEGRKDWIYKTASKLAWYRQNIQRCYTAEILATARRRGKSKKYVDEGEEETEEE